MQNEKMCQKVLNKGLFTNTGQHKNTCLAPYKTDSYSHPNAPKNTSNALEMHWVIQKCIRKRLTFSKTQIIEILFVANFM